MSPLPYPLHFNGILIKQGDGSYYGLEGTRVNVSISEIMTSRGVKQINHSEFVDDTLLIVGYSRIIDHRFKKVLETFYLASRSKINKFKAIYMDGI